MNSWKYSLGLALISAVLLLFVFVSPASYSVFIWTDAGVEPGRLFPVLIISWIAAVSAFGLNNIFIDSGYIENRKQMPRTKKYIPSLSMVPAVISFIWFISRWVSGKP